MSTRVGKNLGFLKKPSLVGFFWVFLGFIGFYWVLLGFIGFYWVLLGFLGFIGFFKFVVCDMTFCCVLLHLKVLLDM